MKIREHRFCARVNVWKQARKQNLKAAEQQKILDAFDGINALISQSRVKEVAGFLFPPQDIAEISGGSGAQAGPGDPFQTCLKSSARLYRSLAEAAAWNLRELEKFAHN